MKKIKNIFETKNKTKRTKLLRNNSVIYDDGIYFYNWIYIYIIN